jgi:hypothetical protein
VLYCLLEKSAELHMNDEVLVGIGEVATDEDGAGVVGVNDCK